MKKMIHKAGERGVAEHGWLHSRFSFSFAEYYNPEKMGFGLLRVLNDDIVEPGTGFGMHPHNNMEIISIVQQGALTHKDSMGHTSTIKPGEVQVMSAGSGILHSEYNNSESEIVELKQIWIMTKERNIKPRYDQKYFNFTEKTDYFETVVSGNKTDDTLDIHQDAAISIAKLEKEKKVKYSMKFKGNGAYLFLLNGSVEVDGSTLEKRDAIGVYDTEEFEITSIENSEFIIIDVPMN